MDEIIEAQQLLDSELGQSPIINKPIEAQGSGGGVSPAKAPRLGSDMTVLFPLLLLFVAVLAFAGGVFVGFMLKNNQMLEDKITQLQAVITGNKMYSEAQAITTLPTPVPTPSITPKPQPQSSVMKYRPVSVQQQERAKQAEADLLAEAKNFKLSNKVSGAIVR